MVLCGFWPMTDRVDVTFLAKQTLSKIKSLTSCGVVHPYQSNTATLAQPIARVWGWGYLFFNQ